MKKKIVSIMIAAIMLASCVTALAAETNRAILLCYDNAGKLAYSTLMKKGEYVSIPKEYESAAKKVYDIDSARFMTIEEYDAISGATPTASPEATAAPAASPADAPSPSATPKATEKPASTPSSGNTPYEKEADGIYAPAVVTGVSTNINKKDEEVYALTVLYHGEEVTVGVSETLQISSAPEAFSYVKGENVLALQEGDVVCMAANVAGTKIKTVDLIYRPVKEDIVTGSEDYGANFEKLFTTGGAVAGKWQYLKYGERASKEKYQYAFGIVAEKNGTSITLLNKSGVTADAIDIDVSPSAYIYSTEVGGKEYDFEIEGPSGIMSSIPRKLMSEDVAVLDNTYSYNYALFRLVDSTATDVIIYKGYND